MNIQSGGHYGEVDADDRLRERSIMFALFDYLIEEGNKEVENTLTKEKEIIKALDN